MFYNPVSKPHEWTQAFCHIPLVTHSEPGTGSGETDEEHKHQEMGIIRGRHGNWLSHTILQMRNRDSDEVTCPRSHNQRVMEQVSGGRIV